MKDCPAIFTALKLAMIIACIRAIPLGLLPQLPNAWAGPDPCDPSDIRATLRDLVAPDDPAVVPRLREFLKSEKLSRDWTWSEPFSRSQEKILTELNALTPDGRKRVLNELSSLEDLKPDQAKTLRLALHDEATWRKLIEDSLTEGMPSLAWMASPGFREAVEKMPQAMKRSLLQFIGEKYPKASSWSFPGSPLAAARVDGSNSAMIAPKRALDAMLRLLYRGDQRLLKKIESGSSPLDAYRSYLRELKSDVFHNVPVGGHSADAVLDLAHQLQSRLVSDEKVFVYGSFPNGSAKKTSDIDLGIWVPPNRRYSDRLLGVFDEMKRSDEPRLSVREYRTEGSRNRMGRFNPVMIEVTKGELKLLIYSPEIRKVENFDYVAPSPAIFSLE